jgi:hypothetical protein
MSWRVISAKWDGIREAFGGFDPGNVAARQPADIARMEEDARVIRNTAKIEQPCGRARTPGHPAHPRQHPRLPRLIPRRPSRRRPAAQAMLEASPDLRTSEDPQDKSIISLLEAFIATARASWRPRCASPAPPWHTPAPSG